MKFQSNSVWAIVALAIMGCATKVVHNRKPSSTDCLNDSVAFFQFDESELLLFDRSSNYSLIDGWLQFSTTASFPRQGFKIHISYRSPEQVKEIFQAVSPYLLSQNVSHKVA